MKEPFVNIAIQAARAAGNIIMRARDRLDIVKVHEKAPNDYVTEVDQKSEKEIVSIIHKAYPDHAIAGTLGVVQGHIACDGHGLRVDGHHLVFSERAGRCCRATGTPVYRAVHRRCRKQEKNRPNLNHLSYASGFHATKILEGT